MPSIAVRHRGSRRPIQNARRPTSAVSRTHLAGLILWLPRRDGLRSHSELPEGCYGHPVVILSPEASSTDKVVVLILTSFGETDVLTKFPHKPTLRRAYMPIYPTRRHPDTAAQLHLEHHAVLHRKSYANTQHQHTVLLDILRAYDRHDTKTRYALTSESYQQLICHAGFVPICSPLGGGALTANSSVSTIRPVPRLTQPPYNSRPAVSPPPTPLTYGTVLVPRVPVGHYGRDLSAARGDYNSQPTQGTMLCSRQPDTLPHYYSHVANAKHNGDNGYGRWEALVALAIIVVLLGASAFGLWSVWAHRAELGYGLLRCLSWVGLHAFQLIEGVVGGVLRGIAWLVAQVLMAVKMVAMKVWSWWRGGFVGGVGK